MLNSFKIILTCVFCESWAHFFLTCLQIIRMNNERFAVPELIFHPSDVGVQEMGITEALISAVESCQPEGNYYNTV